MKKVLIIGEHPIKDDIIRQFRERGEEILECLDSDPAGIAQESKYADEIVILTSPYECDPLFSDSRALDILSGLKKDDDKKKTVHLMLQSLMSLSAMQYGLLSDDIKKSFDVCPFCLTDEWARSIVSEMALPAQPIDIKSNCRQHLVILGMDETALRIAINAALTFHYPNYSRNHRLRSRITIISPEVSHKSQMFIHRYDFLFKHSFYRMIDVSQEKMIVALHRPENLPGQEDYVDIEWEFVIGDSHNEVIRKKLAMWASSGPSQNLILAISGEDDEQNLFAAACLPEAIFKHDVPVYIRQRYGGLAKHMTLTGEHKALHFFGTEGSGYDVSLPLVRMGKIINEVYCQCYNDNYGLNEKRSEIYNATEINSARADMVWEGLSQEKRCSNLFNAMTVPVKLHSVGIPKEDWERCYDLPEPVIQLLSEVEHNRWNVEELLLGFRPCTLMEQELVEKDIAKKEEYKKQYVHYDLRPFRDLRQDKTGRNANVYDVVLTRSLPLIACEYLKEGGNK